MAEDLPGEGDEYKIPPSFFPESSEDREVGDLGELVPVQVDGVYSLKQDGETRHMVVLTDGHRRVSIMIAVSEAHAIAEAVERIERARPNTHDLIRNLLIHLNVGVERVNIDDLFNSTYYARIILEGPAENSIDARPSDAIAIALRFDAPIYVAEGILESSDEI